MTTTADGTTTIVNYIKTASYQQLERVAFDLINQGTRWGDQVDEVAQYFNPDGIPNFVARVSGVEETDTTSLTATMSVDDAKRVVYSLLGRLRTSDAGQQSELMALIDQDE